MNKKSRLKKILLGMCGAVLIVIIVLSVSYLVLVASGKNNIYSKVKKEDLNDLYNAMNSADLSGNELKEVNEDTNMSDEESETKLLLDSDNLSYNGKIYKYNEKIMTFLFMGIDQNGEVKQAKDGISGGQSDTMFLLILNPETKEISMLGINRDTISDIDIYDESGNFVMTDKMQITLQHGYGDGLEQSCERSCEAVSNLFYGIPINGYCSVNIGAVVKLNDAVGGVDVITPNDIEIYGVTYHAGETIHLMGENAKWFVQTRDVMSFNSAGARLERQKVYLSTYMKKAISKTKKQSDFPIELYQILSKYLVTDLSIDEITYLASEANDYTFNGTNIYSIPGKTVRGDQFEEFYPDKQGLYEMVLDIFYEKVKE